MPTGWSSYSSYSDDYYSYSYYSYSSYSNDDWYSGYYSYSYTGGPLGWIGGAVVGALIFCGGVAFLCWWCVIGMASGGAARAVAPVPVAPVAAVVVGAAVASPVAAAPVVATPVVAVAAVGAPPPYVPPADGKVRLWNERVFVIACICKQTNAYYIWVCGCVVMFDYDRRNKQTNEAVVCVDHA